MERPHRSPHITSLGVLAELARDAADAYAKLARDACERLDKSMSNYENALAKIYGVPLAKSDDGPSEARIRLDAAVAELEKTAQRIEAHGREPMPSRTAGAGAAHIKRES